MKLCQIIGSALFVVLIKGGLRRFELMRRVELNPDTEEVGNTFKVIAISLTVGLNLLVFGWLFFFSGLVK